MMDVPQEQLDELKRVFGSITTAEEGGRIYIRIEQLPLPIGCVPKTTTALLSPFNGHGYASRLFFLEKIQHRGNGNNWNANGVCILGENWWAFSWNVNPSNKTLLSKVLGFLEAMTSEASN